MGAYVDLGVRGIQGIYDVYQPQYAVGQIPVGRWPVGTCGRMSDGRIFFYTRGGNTGGALAAAKLYQKAANVGDHLICACAASAAAAGQNVITGVTIGGTAMAVNQYAGGFLAVTDGTGAGQMFKILKHPAFLAAASTVTATLEDNFTTALDATSKVGFFKNKWDTPTLAATTALCYVGVPLVTVPQETAATALVNGTASFVWFQTWGPCNVLANAANVVDGATVVPSGVAGGAVMADTTAGGAAQLQIAGTAMTTTATTKYGPVDLRICAG